MKKWGIILIGLIFALSATGLALAQEKAKPAEAAKPAAPAKPAEVAKPAAPAKPAEAAKPAEVKKEAPKPVMFRAGGLVVARDVKARKITIKQDQVKRERKLVLTVSKKAAKNLAGINVGDEVNIWVTGKTVTTLTKIF